MQSFILRGVVCPYLCTQLTVQSSQLDVASNPKGPRFDWQNILASGQSMLCPRYEQASRLSIPCVWSAIPHASPMNDAITLEY